MRLHQVLLPAMFLMATLALSEEAVPRKGHVILRLVAEDSLKLNAGLFLASGGPGPYCLLLHDRASEGKNLAFVANQLREQGIHVMLPDLRGHGLSDDPIKTYAAFRDSFSENVIGKLTDDMEVYSNFASHQSVFPDSAWTVLALGESAVLGMEYLRREPRVTRLVLLSPILPEGVVWPQFREDAEYLLLACDEDERSRADLVQLYLQLPEGNRRMDMLACRSRGRGMLKQQPDLIDRVSEWLRR